MFVQFITGFLTISSSCRPCVMFLFFTGSGVVWLGHLGVGGGVYMDKFFNWSGYDVSYDQLM